MHLLALFSNVADDATRETDDPLDIISRWSRGPNFLRDLPSQWPGSNANEVNLQTKGSVLITDGMNTSVSDPMLEGSEGIHD